MASLTATDQSAPAPRTLPLWPWIIGCGLVLLLFLRDLSVFADGRIGHEAVWGRDFANLWTGGQLLNAGRVDILTNIRPYQHFQTSLFGPLAPHNYSYPPVSYPIAQLFALLPYPAALAAWIVATGALFMRACQPWWPKDAGPQWLAVLTPAALLNIWAGHYGFLLGAIFLFGWHNLDRRPVLAGVFFGLMLIKPHLALLVPLALLLRREWTATLVAAATAIALVAITGAVYGWGCWRYFLFHTSVVQAGMIDAGRSFFGLLSTSFATAALRATDSWLLAVVGQLLFALGGVILVVLAVRRRCPTDKLGLLVASATFMALPYAFAYDLTVVTMGAVVVMAAGDSAKQDRRWATFGFMAPSLGILFAFAGIPLMPILIALLAIAQFRAACGPIWVKPGGAAARAAPAAAT